MCKLGFGAGTNSSKLDVARSVDGLRNRSGFNLMELYTYTQHRTENKTSSPEATTLELGWK